MRALRALATTAALLAATLTAATTGANAASNVPSGYGLLCKGFTDCDTKGYGNAGYAPTHTTSYWSMTPGHNCTNYIAYRLTNNGRVTTHRDGFGGAAYWDSAAKTHKLTRIKASKTPKTGDIAWWKKGAKGAPTGHVAYIEKVTSKYIIVSEDNYKGDFQWRAIRKGDKYYPTGFIRFPQSNGDPYAKLYKMSAKKSGNLYQVTATGWATEPNAPTTGTTLTMSLNGKIGTKGSTQHTLTRNFNGYYTVMVSNWQKPTSAYIYVNNAPGTPGKQIYIGGTSKLKY